MGLSCGRGGNIRAAVLAAGFVLAGGLASAAGAADAFFMPVEDVFYINGIGTVATGKVERGTVQRGDKVEVIGIRPSLAATIVRIERFNKAMDSAVAGDEIGLVLRGVDKDAVERGQAIVTPGSMTAAVKVTVDFQLSAKGRSKPVEGGYRPLVKVHTSTVSATLGVAKPVAPGESGAAIMQFEEPTPVAVGDSFELTEGGTVVGTGVVRTIVQ